MAFVDLLSGISGISIVLFLLGIILIAIEMFQPGFGFFGGLGVVSLIVCIFVTARTVMEGIILTAIFFVIFLIFLTLFFAFFKGRLPKTMILRDSESVELGYSGVENMRDMVGKKGTVITVCRPAGTVDFDGMRLDVVSRGEFIEKGKTVEVIEVEGRRIVIKEM